MARAPDNATYISDAQPLYISKEEAARYNADPVPYSGKQVVNIYNTPSGITNSVQFLKTSTEFGGDTGFTYNSTTSSVNIQGNLNVGGLINGKFYTNTANFRITGGNTGQILTTTGNGNLSWTTFPDVISSDWNANSGVSQILNKPNLQVYLTTSSFNSTINNYVTSTEFHSRFANLSNVATTGSYNDLTNKPNLSNLAVTGSYNDLSGRPTLPTSIFNLDVPIPDVSVNLPAYLYYTGSELSWQKIEYANIQGTPTLSTVATTGNYNDLSNKPANVSHFNNDANYVHRTEMETYVSNQITASIDALKANVTTDFDTLKELADSLKFLLSINIDGGDASGGTPIDGSDADTEFTTTLDGGSA
jgi:hypothetical protein